MAVARAADLVVVALMVPIRVSVPYDFEATSSRTVNLCRAYNQAMAMVPDGGWGVLLDHDVHLTTKGWAKDIQAAIATKPDAGAFSATASRIAAPWQQVGDPECFDLGKLYAFGEQRRQHHRTLLDITDTKGFGGVVIVVSKAAWLAVGKWPETYPAVLCVDHWLHFALRKKGYRNYLIESLFVYHQRRAFCGELPADTPRMRPCPCRGPEAMPTVRIPLLEAA